MAQVAYDRTVAAADLTSPAGDRRVVTNTFDTYFGVTDPLGRQYRLSHVLGRRFWMAVFGITYAADELISGILKDVKDQAFNLNPDIVFLCDDTYLTESPTDEGGIQLAPGVYQPVSQ